MAERLTREFFAAAGRRGARKLNAALTPEQRKASAQRAARARWRNHKPQPAPHMPATAS